MTLATALRPRVIDAGVNQMIDEENDCFAHSKCAKMRTNKPRTNWTRTNRDIMPKSNSNLMHAIRQNGGGVLNETPRIYVVIEICCIYT
jgi:hypothetical protein